MFVGNPCFSTGRVLHLRVIFTGEQPLTRHCWQEMFGSNLCFSARTYESFLAGNNLQLACRFGGKWSLATCVFRAGYPPLLRLFWRETTAYVPVDPEEKCSVATCFYVSHLRVHFRRQTTTCSLLVVSGK